MKLTESQIRQIIQEELTSLQEQKYRQVTNIKDSDSSGPMYVITRVDGDRAVVEFGKSYTLRLDRWNLGELRNALSDLLNNLPFDEDDDFDAEEDKRWRDEEQAAYHDMWSR